MCVIYNVRLTMFVILSSKGIGFSNSRQTSHTSPSTQSKSERRKEHNMTISGGKGGGLLAVLLLHYPHCLCLPLYSLNKLLTNFSLSFPLIVIGEGGEG